MLLFLMLISLKCSDNNENFLFQLTPEKVLLKSEETSVNDQNQTEERKTEEEDSSEIKNSTTNQKEDSSETKKTKSNQKEEGIKSKIIKIYEKHMRWRKQSDKNKNISNGCIGVTVCVCLYLLFRRSDDSNEDY